MDKNRFVQFYPLYQSGKVWRGLYQLPAHLIQNTEKDWATGGLSGNTPHKSDQTQWLNQ